MSRDSRDWQRLAPPATLTSFMLFLEQAYWLCWIKEPLADHFGDVQLYENEISRIMPADMEDRMSDFPLGVKYLVMAFTDDSALPRVLLNLAPMTIFTEVPFRQYTNQSAPAIMSALRLTDWYIRRNEPGAQTLFWMSGPWLFSKKRRTRSVPYFSIPARGRKSCNMT
jgi:hypothetical protein